MTRTLLAVHGDEARLKPQHLPPSIADLRQRQVRADRASKPPRARRDRDLELLEQELKHNGGNVKAAAKAVGISRQRVYRLLDGVRSKLDDVSAQANVNGERVNAARD